MAWYVYVLQCSDLSYYVGHAADVAERLKVHNDGAGAAYTATRRPLKLVYSELLPDRQAAVARERQIKGWSRVKKEALIAGAREQLHRLSRCRSVHPLRDGGGSSARPARPG